MEEEIKITQEQVDAVHPTSIAEWKRMLKSSGKTELMFKVSKEAVQFLGEYQQVKEYLAEHGFEIPPLLDGVQVKFVD